MQAIKKCQYQNNIDMSKICIVIMLGIPGAGKTSLCKYLEMNLKREETNLFHVQYDNRELETDISYRDYRQKNFQIVKGILQTVDKQGISIILVDDVMYYRSMRHVYYNLAKNYQAAYCQIHVKCHLNTAITRNETRSVRKVPVHTLQNIYEKLEEPSQEPWECHSCIVDSEQEYDESTLCLCTSVILKALEKPPCTPVPVTTHAHEPSLVNYYDLLLRKLINLKMKEIKNKHSVTVVRNVSKIMCAQKAEILKKLKIGQLTCTDDVAACIEQFQMVDVVNIADAT